MADKEETEKEKELREAEEATHERTVDAARHSLDGIGGPLVSESVAADPVARNSEPYKSLLKSQQEDGPVEAPEKTETDVDGDGDSDG